MDGRTDPRSVETREALLAAFWVLLQQHRYGALRIADIADKAGVSRSTFYEYFNSRDDILTQSMFGPFAVLADITSPEPPLERLCATFAHFWRNRRLARQLLEGEPRRRAARRLAELIEKRLPSAPSSLPPRLLAQGVADMQLAMLHAWLTGEAPAAPESLASAMGKVVRGAINAA